MSKYIPAYFIFLFWIILPLPFMIMGYNSFMRLDFISVLENFEIGGLSYILGFLQLMGIYIKTFFLTIPNAPVWLNMGLIFPLKAVSLLVALFTLKE